MLENKKSEKSTLCPKSPLGSLSYFASIPWTAMIRLDEIEWGEYSFKT
jgi:hypothetical protein